MVEFTFGQVEAVLAHMNQIAADKRVAFTSRLKHLQNQGIVGADRKPGRGKAATYSFGDLIKFVVGMDLIQSGVPPISAGRLVNINWLTLTGLMREALSRPVELRDPMDEHLLVLTPSSLRELMNELAAPQDEADQIFLAIKAKDLMSEIVIAQEATGAMPNWRTLVINATYLFKALVHTISVQYRFAGPEELRNDILEEELPLRRAMEKFIDETDHEELIRLWDELSFVQEVDFSTDPPLSASAVRAKVRRITYEFEPEVREALTDYYSEHRKPLTEPIKKALIESGLMDVTETGLALNFYGLAALRTILIDEDRFYRWQEQTGGANVSSEA